MATLSLEEALRRIADLEKRSAAAQSQQESAGSSSGVGQIIGWLVGLVLAAGVAIGAYLLMRDLKKKNAELARLRTKVEQDKVKQRNLEHAADVAVHLEEAVALRQQAGEIASRIRVRTQLADAQERAFSGLEERIRRAQNWDDLDALNKENRQ